jgi:hypothetical protein
MSRLSFALAIAVLFVAIVVLSAFALRTLFVSSPADNEDQAEATQEMTQAPQTTEETTALEEETTVQQGAGDLKRPPDSTLSYGGREVKGSLGSYCWGNMCADTSLIVPPREKTLTVPSGSEMVFRYGGQRPSGRVQAVAFPLTKNARSTASPDPNRSRSLKAHGSGVERTIPVGLPPGEYLVHVFVIVVVEPQNDATYFFRVMVE